MLLLLYKESFFLSSDLTNKLPSVIVYFLKQSEDVFPEKPRGLPPLSVIQHQINSIHRAPILNMPVYISNIKETKEIERQVEDLMSKGYMREILSPCALPMILEPKKMVLGGYAGNVNLSKFHYKVWNSYS